MGLGQWRVRSPLLVVAAPEGAGEDPIQSVCPPPMMFADTAVEKAPAQIIGT